MLAWILIIGIFVGGAMHLSVWLLLPATLLAGINGQVTRPQGFSLASLFGAIPLLAIFNAIIFGLGWAAGTFT
tara:strand:+ start:178 stop:396 length:219 start_codon:yes stop_codon:yes gene_type:complete